MRRRSAPALALAAVLALAPVAGASPARTAQPDEPPAPATPTPGAPAPASPTSPAPSPARRGIVLMTVDSLRVDRVGCYIGGTSLTPGMDLLARSGVRFDRAYTASVSTAPSVASLMTGLEPAHHGLRNDRMGRLSESVPTLAQSLHAAGWSTAAIIGTDLLGTQRGLARGFDRYDQEITGLKKIVVATSKERRASEVAERALTAIDAMPADKPFFIWLNFYDPHYDYDPAEAQKTAHPDAPYDGEVATVDDAVGAVVRNVRSRMPGGRLTFVLAGTHGEGLGDHGEVGHGFYLHETTARVPLIIVPETAPPAGIVDPGPVSLVDVAPTLMAIAGVQPAAPMDGGVLGAVVTAPRDNGTKEGRGRRDQKAGGPRRVYVEAAAPYLSYGWSPLAALIEGERKVVVSGAGRVEAFDLKTDPSGSRPLSKTPRWASDLAREATARLGSLDPPAERREAVAAAAGAIEYPWGNSPFCLPKDSFPDPRDPDRVALSALLFPARVEADQGIFGRAGKTGIKVVETDPTNLSALDMEIVLGFKNRWAELLLGPIEVMTCDYPYRGDGYHYLGHYYNQMMRDLPRALAMFKIMAIADPESEEAAYDLACAYAAMDQKDEAFAQLRRAIDLGAHDFEYMRRDYRLNPLRADPRLAELIPATGG